MHRVLTAGADWVSKNAYLFDRFALAPLNRIVRPYHQGHACRHKGGDQKAKQNLGHDQAGPFGPIQHPMIILKLGIVLQPHGTQNCRHCALVRRQNRTNRQELDHIPDPIVEGLRKWHKNCDNLSR